MLKAGRCLARLTYQAQRQAVGSFASQSFSELPQECLVPISNAAAAFSSRPSRSFHATYMAQQQSGSPMMESHASAEEGEVRQGDPSQPTSAPQATAEVSQAGEPKGVEGEMPIDTQTYQPGTRQIGENVPAGHMNSSLTAPACSLVLGRRRDLTLRGDIKLSRGSHTASLMQLLKNRVAIIVGLPDLGPVCTEKHVPGFLEKLDEIVDSGISRVYCVSHAPTGMVGDWSRSVGIEDRDKIEAWADDTGSLCRMLGLEASYPTEGGAGKHRWAAITQDGILLKMRVEDTPTQVEETSAESMLGCWKYFKELESVK